MGSFDGKMHGRSKIKYILRNLSKIIDKYDTGLYKVDSHIILRKCNRKKDRQELKNIYKKMPSYRIWQ